MVSAGQLQVREADDSLLAEWDRYVERCPEATFFHRSGWKRVIESCFGHRTYYLYAERAGHIAGILPLVHIDSAIFGRSLKSLAFCVYGGTAASDEAARSALDRATRELGERLDVTSIEYRDLEPRAYPDATKKSGLYVTFRKSIDADPEKNMLAVPRKQRAMIRKGQKFALRSEIDADCARLHRIYAESVRNLGTPVFSRKYFEALRTTFGKDCEILVITKDEEPLAAVMSFYFRDEVLPYYAGDTLQSRELAANDFKYWELMRRAVARGCRVFDYGRSKRDTGPFAFKKNWGFEPSPLAYEHHLYVGDTIPQHNPANPRYRALIGLWRRLPRPIVDTLGPMIVRNLG